MVKFDRRGRCVTPGTVEHAVKQVVNDQISDVIVFSHGWNNDWDQAITHYKNFVSGYLAQSTEISVGEPRRVLLIGVFWPSKALVGSAGKGPQFAGADASSSDIDELGTLLEGHAAQRWEELVHQARLTPTDAQELVGLFAPLFARDAREVGESGPVDPAKLIQAWEADDVDTDSEELNELGYFDDEDDSNNATVIENDDRPEMQTEPEIAGLRFVSPGEIIRGLTVWQMKDRAGVVGERGVGPLLAELKRTGARVHCVGHSYGAKVMLSAISSADLVGRIRSALLLQPAISHLCFADTVPGMGRPGGYRDVLGRVELPILSTFSRHDDALTGMYAWALRRRRDLGEPEVAAAGDPPSRYAALGGYGPRGLGRKSKIIDVRDPGSPYPLVGAADDLPRVYGVQASRTISGHSDISNPSTWWMLQQLVRSEG